MPHPISVDLVCPPARQTTSLLACLLGYCCCCCVEPKRWLPRRGREGGGHGRECAPRLLPAARAGESGQHGDLLLCLCSLSLSVLFSAGCRALRLEGN